MMLNETQRRVFYTLSDIVLIYGSVRADLCVCEYELARLSWVFLLEAAQDEAPHTGCTDLLYEKTRACMMQNVAFCQICVSMAMRCGFVSLALMRLTPAACGHTCWKKGRCACDHPQMVQAAVGQVLTKTQTPSLHPDQTSAAAVMAFQSLTADI